MFAVNGSISVEAAVELSHYFAYARFFVVEEDMVLAADVTRIAFAKAR